jgi:hypothetical protein
MPAEAAKYNYDGLNRRGNVVGALIRPGAMVKMFTWEAPATPKPAFEALRRQIGDIEWSACYCSVFEECYVRKSRRSPRPEPVKQCVPPAVTFQPDYRDDR